MEKYFKNRPQKHVFDKRTIKQLRNKAINQIKEKFLPNAKIIKIILIGSSLKNSFGKYDPPGFRGSLYSDFDFIIFVDDDYQIPSWLNKEPAGKPFPEDSLNLAYRNKKFVDNKYDVEIFFIRQKSMSDEKIEKLAEQAGIPLSKKSKHPHIVI